MQTQTLKRMLNVKLPPSHSINICLRLNKVELVAPLKISAKIGALLFSPKRFPQLVFLEEYSRADLQQVKFQTCNRFLFYWHHNIMYMLTKDKLYYQKKSFLRKRAFIKNCTCTFANYLNLKQEVCTQGSDLTFYILHSASLKVRVEDEQKTRKKLSMYPFNTHIREPKTTFI